MATSVLIIGTGFGGLAMALELKRAGLEDFTILEQADEVGGVWRDNTYPGAGCDIPSPYYSYSFAPNLEWPRRFSRQADILRYIREIVDEYGLRPHIRFGTEVTAAAFDTGNGRWAVDTNTGIRYEADVFVPAVGQLSRPSIPNIPGRDNFTGSAFHSARWRHDIDLRGKRVAVIGTGASAIQFAPQIQPDVQRLTLFQRSAPYIAPKPDTTYRTWQHRLFRLVPAVQKAERFGFWSFFEISTLGILGNKAIARAGERVALGHLRKQVPDPALRAKLTPDYAPGCKRALFSNNYFPALTQPNVHVETGRIAEITATGVRTADGVHHDADVIVYGTGFTAQEFLAPIKVTGLGGRDLRENWSEGARAYLGMSVPGFPNMFLMYGPNTNIGAGSIIYMHERQARYIRRLVEYLDTHPRRYLDVRTEVEQRYDTEIQQRLDRSAWTSCASWYRAESGRVSTNWPGLVSEYSRRTRHPDPGDYRIVSLGAS
ncbi:flavin-containing monooxygenase [Nocardia sp. NBC_01388]|uniref:flavin-containing monooxygenase n=1 Tax=Nocardia sp. NBC_01388 TaxID=2903596 RepID=UPI00386FBF4A